MATLDDVQNAMVNVIEPVIYPDGNSNPSIINQNVYIFAGDPLKLDLDNILRQQQAVIVVFAQKAMTRNTTRVRDLYADEMISAATIILNVLANTVTINGTVTAGQVSMVIVDGVGYAYMALTGDTLNTIAAALAVIIPNATALNNVITITGTFNIEARVSVPGTMRRILQSEEGLFRARVIAATHEAREALGKALQLAFLKLDPRYYLQMPDGISASIRGKGTQETNIYELDLAFVRDYLYLVEYHTVDVSEFQTIADAYQNTTVSNLPIS